MCAPATPRPSAVFKNGKNQSTWARLKSLEQGEGRLGITTCICTSFTFANLIFCSMPMRQRIVHARSRARRHRKYTPRVQETHLQGIPQHGREIEVDIILFSFCFTITSKTKSKHGSNSEQSKCVTRRRAMRLQQCPASARARSRSRGGCGDLPHQLQHRHDEVLQMKGGACMLNEV